MNVYRWVRDQGPRTTPAGLLVLFVLATYTNSRGYCWPAQATIADCTGLSVRQVIRVVAVLERDGLLVKVERRKMPGQRGLGAWIYRLPVPVDKSADYVTPMSPSQPRIGDISSTDYMTSATRIGDTSVTAEVNTEVNTELGAGQPARAQAGAVDSHRARPASRNGQDAIAACGLCDAAGWVEVSRAGAVPTVQRCTHGH